MIKKLLVAAAMMFSSLSFADDHAPPPMEVTPELAAMRYCQTFGIRAAWGAQARFFGAPATFKYINEADLKKMFWGDPKDMPHDGIYILEDLDLSQRRQYEEVAFYGWKQAGQWMKANKARPDFEVLTAIFIDGCKKQLTKPVVKKQ